MNQPRDPKRSDGKSVRVTLFESVNKGDFIRNHVGARTAFYGFAMQSGVSDDEIAINIAREEFELVVEETITAYVGKVLYLDVSSGTILNDTGGASAIPFMKVTKAKDENNVIWGILLPQIYGFNPATT